MTRLLLVLFLVGCASLEEERRDCLSKEHTEFIVTELYQTYPQRCNCSREMSDLGWCYRGSEVIFYQGPMTCPPILSGKCVSTQGGWKAPPRGDNIPKESLDELWEDD